MKLYDAAWAPSPRRVRIFLAEKGITVERVTLDLRRDEQLSDPFLKINPRGAVPALQLDDGEVLTESAAICRYFEALHPEPALFGRTPVEIGWIECWTRRIEQDGYAACVYTLRNGAPGFANRGEAGKWPDIPQIPDLVARGQIMWEAFATALDARLGDRPWVAGDAFSFADITALVTLDFARAAKLPLPDEAPHLRRWLATMTARPSAGA